MRNHGRKRNVLVVPAGSRGGFVARLARGRPIFRDPVSQAEAIARAIPIARRMKSEVVIHRPDGRIRDKDSYGPDSPDDRDTKH